MFKPQPPRSNNNNFMTLVGSIVSGDTAKVLEIINASPDLVRQPSLAGASRQEASQYFFPEIRHYLYAGDTALHMEGGGFKLEIGEFLVDNVANTVAQETR